MRNKRNAIRKESTWEGIVSTMTLIIVKWACTGKEFANLKIDNVQNNWGAPLLVGVSKQRRKDLWSSPTIGVLKFYVDGTR